MMEGPVPAFLAGKHYEEDCDGPTYSMPRVVPHREPQETGPEDPPFELIMIAWCGGCGCSDWHWIGT